MGTERRGRTSVKMQGRDECAERRNKGMRPIKKMIEDEGEGLCRCNKRQEYDSKWKTMQMLQGKIDPIMAYSIKINSVLLRIVDINAYILPISIVVHVNLLHLHVVERRARHYHT